MPPEHGSRAEGPSSSLVCHGCGYQVPLDEVRPYRCRNSMVSDNIDHVLRRSFDAATFRSRSNPEALFRDREPNPFRKFRRLFHSYEVARLGGISDRAFVQIVDRIDAAVAAVDGHGFVATPFAPAPNLARALRSNPDRLWVKDETRNVSGSHKARHLMGIMVWLEVERELSEVDAAQAELAIASCGNAALAAAVLARAAGRPLEVFVPPDANRGIIGRLADLGARLTYCERRDSDPFGDPCYLRFLDAARRGALPYTVQGSSNGLAVEGGCTLAWEMVATLLDAGAALDHLVIQVGGGALAAACVEGLRNARDLGLIERLPRVHTVQTASAYPLRRAYDRIAARLLAGKPPPDRQAALATDDARALWLRDQIRPEVLGSELRRAARHRADFMWAWETPPKSIAYGILDDETYDWIAVCEGMLETAGIPLVASEERLAEAHELANAHTAIPVEPTGSAGLAGLLELRGAGIVGPEESVALLFTGRER